MEKSPPKRNWRVLFAGTPAYAVPSLEALLAIPGVEVVGVLTQKPKPRGRGNIVQPSAVEAYATAHNLLVLTPDRLRIPETMALLESVHADVGVVVAYGKLIPPALLAAMPYGWINAHASLLPRWRGASPIQQTILAGDTESGVTLMRLDAGMDTGPIVCRERVAVVPNETSTHLAHVLSELSGVLLRKNVLAYLVGEVQPTPQPTVGVTLAPQIAKTDGLLSLAESAAQLERKIRAYTPWPGTSLRLGNLEIRILEATAQPGTAPVGSVQHAPTGFALGTAKDLLVPLRVQVAGKKPVQAAEFVRGYSQVLWPAKITGSR